MRCLLLFILAGSAVKCDESNYFVVEMTEDQAMESKRPFQVYWNVPTMQCRSKKIPFEDLYETFGILQNDGDDFRGNTVSILYDPGLFPALLTNESSGEIIFRNGGVPQEGNLEIHLEVFRNDLELGVPDKDFSGVGIIDFESWRPIFRQNFGNLVPYKDVSYEIEKKIHWWWPKQWVQAEAVQRFEESARTFMQRTLAVAKQMRPNAVWGYYGFPYCYNMAANNMKETCAKNVHSENDRLDWLWAESTALYPSIYSSKELKSSQLYKMIRGRIREAERVNKNGVPILPYFWFRYRDGGYLSDEDLNAALRAIYSSNASGFILWGSSKDVDTVDKCKKLRKYIENTLGPAIAKYTKIKLKNIEEDDIETSTQLPSTGSVNFDPDYHWYPPENYEQNIKKYVDVELKNKIRNNDTKDEISLNNQNSNVLIDLILNNLIKTNNDSNDSVDINTTVVDNDKSTTVVYNDKLTTVVYNDSTTVVVNDTTTANYEDTSFTTIGYPSTTDRETTQQTESTTAETTNEFKFFNEDTFNDFVDETTDTTNLEIYTTSNVREISRDLDDPRIEVDTTTASKSQVVVLNK